MLQMRFGKSLLLGTLAALLLTLFYTIQAEANRSNYPPYKLEWTGGGIAPTEDAPLCPSHNPNEWHGLWDPQRGCHYDHEHKDNPGIIYYGMPEDERIKVEALNRVFGKPGAWFGGTSLSYPWQTFMGANEHYPPANPKNENAMKHAGYGWISEANLQSFGAQSWVKDYRVQYHAIFASPGAVTRYHSYSLEANICQKSGPCQIVRTGGWLDFGHLFAGGRLVDLPGQEGDGVRRRMHTSYNEWYETDVNLFQSPVFWYGRLGHPDQLAAGWQWDGAPNVFERLILILEPSDAWSFVDPDNPYTNYFYCPRFDCNKNGSTIKLHRLEIFTELLEFEGYADRYGLVNEDCNLVGLDCIPTVVEPDYETYLKVIDNRPMREFDFSPGDVWWIKYPN